MVVRDARWMCAVPKMAVGRFTGCQAGVNGRRDRARVMQLAHRGGKMHVNVEVI